MAEAVCALAFAVVGTGAVVGVWGCVVGIVEAGEEQDKAIREIKINNIIVDGPTAVSRAGARLILLTRSLLFEPPRGLKMGRLRSSFI